MLKELTRKGIVDAVIQIINEDGVNTLTMSRVANAAGIAKGTLYLYFENKEDLLEKTFELSLSPLILGVEEILDSDVGPYDKLGRVVRFHLSFFEEHRQCFRLQLYERQKEFNRRDRFGSSRYQRFLDRITGILEEGMRQGLFRQMNPRPIARMFIESLIAMIDHYLWVSSDPQPAKDSRLIIDVFMNGIQIQ